MWYFYSMIFFIYFLIFFYLFFLFYGIFYLFFNFIFIYFLFYGIFYLFFNFFLFIFFIIWYFLFIFQSHTNNISYLWYSCWRSKDELISDVLQWTPTHGCAKAGRPARTYIQQLCEDTGCNPEDLPEAMNDREKWRERVRDIHAGGTTWWWWWYSNRFIWPIDKNLKLWLVAGWWLMAYQHLWVI